MVIRMMGNGIGIKSMGRVLLPGKMAVFTQENTKTINNMEKVFSNGRSPTSKSMKEIGKMASKTVKAKSRVEMEKSSARVFG